MWCGICVQQLLVSQLCVPVQELFEVSVAVVIDSQMHQGESQLSLVQLPVSGRGYQLPS